MRNLSSLPASTTPVHHLENLTRRALVFAARRMEHHGLSGPHDAEHYVVTAVARLRGHSRGRVIFGPLCVEIDRLIALDAERAGGTEGPVH